MCEFFRVRVPIGTEGGTWSELGLGHRLGHETNRTWREYTLGISKWIQKNLLLLQLLQP
jgi:hypothetical protein